LRLGSLHVDHGLLHSLKHLCLHNQHLLKSRRRGWWRVDVLVVLSIVVPVVVVVAVPCVGSGSGGIANVPFSHSPHVAEQPMLLRLPLS
jgi:hypothetical protein